MDSSILPKTSCNIPMPKTNGMGERICENCNKEDVCKYKEDCMKAVKDILDTIMQTFTDMNCSFPENVWLYSFNIISVLPICIIC